MPDGQDPDDLLRAGGPAALKSVLDSAMALIDYLWSQAIAGRNFKTPESRAAAIKALRIQIATIQDPEVQRHYKALIDQRISDTFFSHYKINNSRGGRRLLKPQAAMKPKAPPRKAMFERILLAALINHPALFDHVEEQLGALSFTDPRLQALKAKALGVLAAQPDLERIALCQALQQAGFEKEMRDILHKSLYTHAAFAAPSPDSASVDVAETLASWQAIWQALQASDPHTEQLEHWRGAMGQ